jgi:hypothetical protein
MVESAVRRRSLPMGVACVAALLMTWPLVFHLGSQAAQDTYDAPFQTWQVAWIGHALLHHPLSLFQSNIYWPEKDSLAFSDVLLGYAPAGLIASQGLQAALVVHNLLVLFAYALAFLGAYLLARELGAGAWGGLAAGAAFAYAPWRLVQTGHLHVISSGGIPLALYLLLRGYRRSSARLIAAGWLVASWQMTLGFTLGLQLVYLLPVLVLLAAVEWQRRGRPRPRRAVFVVSVAGVYVYAAATTLMAQPYYRVLHEYPESRKTVTEVTHFSPPMRAFLAAPSDDYLWSGPTAHWRNSIHSLSEGWLFPGVTVVLLALLGLAGAAYSRRLRLGLAAGTVVCWFLSQGLPGEEHPTNGFSLYRLLYDYGPGWDGVRTPGRINTLTSLGLALLAAAGVAFVRRYARRLGFAAPLVASFVLVGAIFAEGFGPLPHPHLGSSQAAVGAPSPQLVLPADFNSEPLNVYWSIAGFPHIANGIGSFIPGQYDRIVQTSKSFPDAGSVAYLRSVGIRSVVLHLDRAPGTAWQDVPARSIAGLGITREEEGNLVVYLLPA